jgi:hypothetical protein
VVLCGTWSETSIARSKLTQVCHIPGHRMLFIPCPRHDSSRLPPSGETCKHTTAPSTIKNVERFSTCWYAPFCYVYLGCCAAEFGSSEGTYELPCICIVSPLCQSQDSSGTVQWLYHFSAAMKCVKCQAAKWNWTNNMTAETYSLTPLIWNLGPRLSRPKFSGQNWT